VRGIGMNGSSLKPPPARRCDSLSQVPRLRSSELLIVAYFVYVSAISPFFMRDFWRTSTLAIAVTAIAFVVAAIGGHLRDWAPLVATLVAFREMNWFARPTDHHLEAAWVQWDRWFSQVRFLFESTGTLLPGFLELCYLLVYAVAPVALWALLANGRRLQMNRFWLVYLTGTLGAYALFPYFPSHPPRTLYPDADLPMMTDLRRFNLFILGNYSIHSSVFPSAHVSSVFSAAWGLLATIPQRRAIGWSMAAYGVLVALATIYGRYHYAVDVAAGLAMSIPALWVATHTKAT